MRAELLTLPQKGFTTAERQWLEELIETIKTVQAVQGANCSINNTDNGQTISASDCTACP